MIWTDENVDRLKTLWSKGSSASVIANIFGCTQNAVIGKIRRLGLPGRELRTKAPRVRKAASPSPSHKRRPTPAIVLEPAPDHPIVPLLKLQAHQCKWPYGDPRAPGFGFCGRATALGSSYCAQHHYEAFEHAAPKGWQRRKRAVSCAHASYDAVTSEHAA